VRKEKSVAIGYFEDLSIGDTFPLGCFRVPEDELIEFARRYDPQSFHIDPVAARQSMFGGLVASGLYTMAVFLRMAIDGFVAGYANLGSPGLNSVRFSGPLRPGDELHGTVVITAVRASRKRPACGVVTWRGRGTNQREEEVLGIDVVALFARRDHGDPRRPPQPD
jgi:acyl dehydratase